MLDVVLFQPEIPPNTGNIARLCAGTGVPLHLIEPLGFSLEDRYLKRAGLDYWPKVTMTVWPDLKAYLEAHGQGRRLVMISSHGATLLHRFSFEPTDSLIFGRETCGLPEEVLALSPYRVRIPMQPESVRSLNLSTAAGIVLYQALFDCGLTDTW